MMPTFGYSGRTRAGRRVSGERVAATSEAAVAALRREQVFVTRVELVKESGKRGPKPHRGKAVPARNLAIFTRQLSVMIDAGMPLVECLETLGKQEAHRPFQEAILRTRAAVEAGSSLADAMREHPRVFDPLYNQHDRGG